MVCIIYSRAVFSFVATIIVFRPLCTTAFFRCPSIRLNFKEFRSDSLFNLQCILFLLRCPCLGIVPLFSTAHLFLSLCYCSVRNYLKVNRIDRHLKKIGRHNNLNSVTIWAFSHSVILLVILLICLLF